MYAMRKANLIKKLQADLKVDVGIIMSPVHVYYYTGFLSDPHERFFALLVDTKSNTTTLFVPTLDLEAAKQMAKVDSFIPVSDTENPYVTLKSVLAEETYAFAIEKSYLSVAAYEQIESMYVEPTFVDIEPFIHEARIQKSASEIEHVRKALEITEQGLTNTLEQITPGMTELQVKAQLEYELTMLGAEGLAFDTIVLSGENSALPHGTSSHRKIKTGDFLLFDFGVHVNGYHSDVTRTFVIGKATEKQQEIYQTVKVANEQAIAAVSVGTPIKNIDIAARQVIEEKGYGTYFTHRTGHGLGLDVHEVPSIHHENEEEVQTGLLFTIEPGIYIPQFGGVRIEDNLYVNEQGEVEVLTSFPKTLTEI